MKKYILLALLILNFIFTQAMEIDFYSRPIQKSCELQEFFSIIKTKKDNFENKLHVYPPTPTQTYPSCLERLFSDYRTNISDLGFLVYCHYPQLHRKEPNFEPRILDSLLKKYQKITIDGYSALGAAITAPTTNEKKRNFIQTLMSYNFSPTPKDIELAELDWYHNNRFYLFDAKKETEKIILVSGIYQKQNLLLSDIRILIVQYMMQQLKNELWLLSTKIN